MANGISYLDRGIWTEKKASHQPNDHKLLGDKCSPVPWIYQHGYSYWLIPVVFVFKSVFHFGLNGVILLRLPRNDKKKKKNSYVFLCLFHFFSYFLIFIHLYIVIYAVLPSCKSFAIVIVDVVCRRCRRRRRRIFILFFFSIFFSPFIRFMLVFYSASLCLTQLGQARFSL